jgi:hypothetical protein
MARESWLALDNENHDQFGAAIVLCQDPSGWCVRSGRCFHDGDCFRSDMAAYRQAAKLVRNIAGDQSEMVASALQEAASHLDTMALSCKGQR